VSRAGVSDDGTSADGCARRICFPLQVASAAFSLPMPVSAAAAAAHGVLVNAVQRLSDEALLHCHATLMRAWPGVNDRWLELVVALLTAAEFAAALAWSSALLAAGRTCREAGATVRSFSDSFFKATKQFGNDAMAFFAQEQASSLKRSREAGSFPSPQPAAAPFHRSPQMTIASSAPPAAAAAGFYGPSPSFSPAARGLQPSRSRMPVPEGGHTCYHCWGTGHKIDACPAKRAGLPPSTRPG